MIERTEERFDIKPKRLAADTAYGSGANLNWLVKDKDIAPHIPVIDKSKREDGTFSREDFTFDKERNVYICPAGKTLHDDRQAGQRWGDTLLPREHVRLSRLPAQAAMLPEGAVAQNPAQHLRRGPRRCPGAGQDRSIRTITPRQKACRDAVRASQAHPPARPAAIAWPARCPVRVHAGCHRPKPPSARQTVGTTTAGGSLSVLRNLRWGPKKRHQPLRRLAERGVRRPLQEIEAAASRVQSPTSATKSANNRT